MIFKLTDFYEKKFLIPVNVICAASAESIKPVILPKIINPFLPIISSINEDNNSIIPTHIIARSKAINPIILLKPSVISAPITNNVPIVAGPTVIGIASGTTAISPSSERFPVISFPLTISTADKNRRMPAPIRKESSVIPKTSKTKLPKKKRKKETIIIANVTRNATLRRLLLLHDLVKAKNMDNVKKGVSKKKNLIQIFINILSESSIFYTLTDQLLGILMSCSANISITFDFILILLSVLLSFVFSTLYSGNFLSS